MLSTLHELPDLILKPGWCESSMFPSLLRVLPDHSIERDLSPSISTLLYDPVYFLHSFYNYVHNNSAYLIVYLLSASTPLLLPADSGKEGLWSQTGLVQVPAG